MIANAMLDFLEGWVIDEVCTGFRAFTEALYSDTPEQRLLMALLEDGRPLSLRQICSKCGVSRALMLPGGRLRRAMERLERRGIVSRSDGQAEEKPRYSLNRGNLTARFMVKVFGARRGEEGLIEATLREGFGT
jgi:hypothetical protein